jgi:hypothetical protein
MALPIQQQAGYAEAVTTDIIKFRMPHYVVGDNVIAVFWASVRGADANTAITGWTLGPDGGGSEEAAAGVDSEVNAGNCRVALGYILSADLPASGSLVEAINTTNGISDIVWGIAFLEGLVQAAPVATGKSGTNATSASTSSSANGGFIIAVNSMDFSDITEHGHTILDGATPYALVGPYYSSNEVITANSPDTTAGQLEGVMGTTEQAASTLVACTVTPNSNQATLMFIFDKAADPVPDASVLAVLGGGVTGTTAVLKAKLSAASTSVSFVVSENEDMSSPIVTTSAINLTDPYDNTTNLTESPYHIATGHISGLSEATTYYYGVMVSGVLRGLSGRIKTAPVLGSTDQVTIAWSSCRQNRSINEGLQRIQELDVDIVAQIGDLFYVDANPGDMPTFDETLTLQPAIDQHQDWYNDAIIHPRFATLLRESNFVYTNDDHDAFGNNRGGAEPGVDCGPGMQQAYREFFPSFIPDPSTLNGTINQSLEWGLVHGVVLDVRSDSNQLTFTDPAAVIIGAVQEAWLLDELLTFYKSTTTELMAIFSPTLWFSSSIDTWASAPAELARIVARIEFLGLSDRIIILTGDCHALAFDDGQSPSPGGVRSYAASGMDIQWAGVKSDDMTYTQSEPEGGYAQKQHGLLTVTNDENAGTIIVNVKGFDYQGVDEYATGSDLIIPKKVTAAAAQQKAADRRQLVYFARIEETTVSTESPFVLAGAIVDRRAFADAYKSFQRFDLNIAGDGKWFEGEGYLNDDGDVVATREESSAGLPFSAGSKQIAAPVGPKHINDKLGALIIGCIGGDPLYGTGSTADASLDGGDSRVKQLSLTPDVTLLQVVPVNAAMNTPSGVATNTTPIYDYAKRVADELGRRVIIVNGSSADGGFMTNDLSLGVDTDSNYRQVVEGIQLLLDDDEESELHSMVFAGDASDETLGDDALYQFYVDELVSNFRTGAEGTLIGNARQPIEILAKTPWVFLGLPNSVYSVSTGLFANQVVLLDAMDNYDRSGYVDNFDLTSTDADARLTGERIFDAFIRASGIDVADTLTANPNAVENITTSGSVVSFSEQADATSYTVTYTVIGGATTADEAIAAAPSGNLKISHSLLNVSDGEHYTLTIKAINANGNTVSESVEGVASATVPIDWTVILDVDNSVMSDVYPANTIAGQGDAVMDMTNIAADQTITSYSAFTNPLAPILDVPTGLVFADNENVMARLYTRAQQGSISGNNILPYWTGDQTLLAKFDYTFGVLPQEGYDTIHNQRNGRLFGFTNAGLLNLQWYEEGGVGTQIVQFTAQDKIDADLILGAGTTQWATYTEEEQGGGNSLFTIYWGVDDNPANVISRSAVAVTTASKITLPLDDQRWSALGAAVAQANDTDSFFEGTYMQLRVVNANSTLEQILLAVSAL